MRKFEFLRGCSVTTEVRRRRARARGRGWRMFFECGRIVVSGSVIEHMARNFEGLFLSPTAAAVSLLPAAIESDRGRREHHALVLPEHAAERARRIATWSRPHRQRTWHATQPVITSADRSSFTRHPGSSARDVRNDTLNGTSSPYGRCREVRGRLQPGLSVFLSRGEKEFRWINRISG